jgi:ERF superfamily
MNASKDCVELLTALCAARLAFPPIPKNREGFSKRRGQKYSYSDIGAVIDATAPVLAQHGLVLVQTLEGGEGGTLLVSSTLFHAASGQWLSTELTVEKPQDMQTFGAVSTYALRFQDKPWS